MNKLKKKSQVSLEYLSTYSWAIIILLTIVSTLAYFGFFNQKTFIETSCNSGYSLYCEDGTIIDDGSNVVVKFKFRNNMNDDIIVSPDIEIIEFPSAGCSGSDLYIPRGEIGTTENCTFPAEIEAGDIEDISFLVKFRRNQSLSTEHFINGGLKTIVVE